MAGSASTQPADIIPSYLASELVLPYLIGGFISFIFFGIGLLQFLFNFNLLSRLSARNGAGRCSRADKFNCALLLLVLVSDVGDSIGKGMFLSQYLLGLVSRGLASTANAPRSVFAICITDGWTATLTHAVYARRLIKITPHASWGVWSFVAVAMTISVAQFAASIVTGVLALTPTATWYPKGYPSMGVWLGGAVICDWMLCIVFCFSLSRHRNRHFKQTSSIITRWMAYTIETNLVTSIMQLLHLTLFIAMKDKPYHFVFAMIAPKLYTNCLLFLLSTVFRNRLRSQEAVISAVGSSQDGGRNSRKRCHLASSPGREQRVDFTNGVMIRSEKSVDDSYFEMPVLEKFGEAC